MKPDQKPEQDPGLNQVLKQWVVDTPLPARFQEQVWRRIERAESRGRTETFWSLLTRWVEASIPRPKLAYSYAAILLAVGVAAGAWAGQARSSRMEVSLGTRYLQAVNPYQAVPDVR